MAFFDRFRRPREARAMSPISWAALNPPGGVPASSPRQAENLATVLACVNAVASGIASLPARVYRQAEGGRVEAPSHPVARLLRQPNDRLTWPDLMEWTIGQVLLWGNALWAVDYDGAGRPTALDPIPWASVTILTLHSGRVAYDVNSGTSPRRRLLADEVFHLKDRSDDGLIGRSRLSRAPEVLDGAAGVQAYAAAIWRNSATPSGLYSVDGPLDADQHTRLRAWLDQNHTGAHRAGAPLILDRSAKWTPTSMSPEDAETIDSRRFTVAEICRVFGVPPPIVQDYSHSTFTNAAQASLWFAQNTLAPWAAKIEAEFSRSLFVDDSCSLEIDLSGLTRGDYVTRWQANVAAVQAGILTRDEVREQEGYGPLPKAAVPSPKAVAPYAQPVAKGDV